MWAAGEQLTPAGLAHALIAAGAMRAIELDINYDWVAGYLYVHHPSGPSPCRVVPGQHGIAGELLAARHPGLPGRRIQLRVFKDLLHGRPRVIGDLLAGMAQARLGALVAALELAQSTCAGGLRSVGLGFVEA